MISKIGQEMLAFQEKIAKEYHYKPIEPNLFLGDVREKYRKALPPWCKENGGNTPLFTHEGTLFASGYRRIVIGDYGAFVEITPEQILPDAVKVENGQEYRLNDPQYRDRCKYFWYTVKDSSHVKLYFQQKTVSYADYLVGMWYVSPYEVVVSHGIQGKEE